MNPENWTRLIAASVVPIVVISAAGLLCLAFYNRLAAIVTRSLPRDVPLVATGYLYLETIVNSRPDAIAWPEEQAQHPGWRAIPNRGSAPPPGVFFWVGERFAPELAILRQTREVEPVYVNSRAVVARVR